MRRDLRRLQGIEEQELYKNHGDYSEIQQEQFVIAMGYGKEGWERHQCGSDYIGSSAPKRCPRRCSHNNEEEEVTNCANISAEMCPYIVSVQVAAPSYLTFIAQPMDITGISHEDWINYFTDSRIVKVMIVADSGQIAMRYRTRYGQLSKHGVFDLENIYYWPELKESGKLGVCSNCHGNCLSSDQ